MIYIEKTSTHTLEQNGTLEENDVIWFYWNGDWHSATCVYLYNLGLRGPDDVIRGCVFDNIVCKIPMHSSDSITNFQESDLYEWLHTQFLQMFSEDMRDRISDVTIPKIADIFYRSEDHLSYGLFYPNKKVVFKPLPALADPKNRVCFDIINPLRLTYYWTSDWYNGQFGTACNDIGLAKPTTEMGVRPILILR